MAKYNIHAGHGLSGGVGCGAVGILDESKEARNVKNKLIDILRKRGDIVYDCTFEGSASQNTILNKIKGIILLSLEQSSLRRKE